MYSGIKKSMEGVLGCLPPMILSERSTLFTCALFLAASLVFGMILGLSLSWLSSHDEGSDFGVQPTLVGAQATSALVNIIESRDDQAQERKMPLSGARVHIQAPNSVLLHQARDWVLYTGGELGQRDSSDVELSWDEKDQSWQIYSLRSQSPELALLGWFSLRRSAPEFHYQQGLSGLPNPKAGTVIVGSRPVNEGRRIHSMRVVAIMLVFFCAILPSLGLMVYLSGVLSFEVEKERGSGALESFAMASRPIWIMFFARALACSLLPTLCSAIMLSVACAFIGFPPALVLILVLACLWSMSVVLNLIGQIQVVWFHSQWSRVIGVILFNPLATSLFILLFFSYPLSTWSVGRVEDLATQTNTLPLVGWTVSQAMSTSAVILPVSAILSIVLCAAINWRLGVRRQGLSRIL